MKTPLTEQNDYKMPGLITAEQAALEITEGWRRGEFEIHFPKRFTLWLKAMRHLGYGAYFAAVGRATGKAQSGYVYHYAFVMLLGVAGLLTFALWAWAA